MNTTTKPLVWLAPLAAAVLAVGCTADQRRGLGEEDARDALTMQVERAVADRGLELDGDLACRAALAVDSALTAECAGLTVSGVVVAGAFDGTADVGAESCSVRLIIEIDETPVVERPQVDCFDVR